MLCQPQDARCRQCSGHAQAAVVVVVAAGISRSMGHACWQLHLGRHHRRLGSAESRHALSAPRHFLALLPIAQQGCCQEAAHAQQHGAWLQVMEAPASVPVSNNDVLALYWHHLILKQQHRADGRALAVGRRPHSAAAGSLLQEQQSLAGVPPPPPLPQLLIGQRAGQHLLHYEPPACQINRRWLWAAAAVVHVSQSQISHGVQAVVAPPAACAAH